MTGFGERVRRQRQERGWTQEELAERAQLAVRTVREIEAGRVRRPHRESRRLLADALGLGAEPAPLGCQLPPEVPDLTGRSEQLATLERHLLGTGAVPIAVVTGAPGTGKTALAVRAAHRVRGIFPDGQLHAQLRRPGGEPVPATEVLAQFLRALGLTTSTLPEDAGERTALLRARLTGRRVLMVLDDAVGAGQVRPLLPATAGCAVLVTSRSALTSIEGGLLVELGVLAADDALRLLDRVVGADRVAAEREAAREVVQLCGHLPLAVRIAGARLAARPGWPVSALAARLADEDRRLTELASGDLAVRASLEVGYRGLPAEARRALRLFGLLRVPSVPAWIPSALLGIAPPAGETVLDRLLDARLVEAAPPGQDGEPRYRLHDLVRAFARERAGAEEAESDRRDALGRALGGWLALAERADRLLPGPAFCPATSGARRWEPAVGVADRLLGDPAAWFEAERATLVAAVEQAGDDGLHDLCWDLATSLTGFFHLRWHDDDWRRTQAVALAAAERAGDAAAVAHVLRSSADMRLWQGRMTEAGGMYEQAVAGFEELGDHRGLGYSLAGLAACDRATGRTHSAEQRLTRAQRLFDRIGHRHGTAWVLHSRGLLHRDAHRFDEAAELLLTARDAFRAEGDERWEEHAVRAAGFALIAVDPSRARAQLHRALAMNRRMGDPIGIAHCLQGLGDLERRDGDPERARALLTEAGQRYADAAEPLGRGLTLHVLGDLHVAQCRLEAARDCLSEAVAVLRRAEAPRLLGLALASAAAAARATGDRAAEAEHRREALALLESIGAPEAAGLTAAGLAQPA